MGDSLLPIDLGPGRTVINIAAGGSHTCAVLDDGTAKCWGRNTNGQLGQNHTDNLGDDGSEMGSLLLTIALKVPSAWMHAPDDRADGR